METKKKKKPKKLDKYNSSGYDYPSGIEEGVVVYDKEKKEESDDEEDEDSVEIYMCDGRR